MIRLSSRKSRTEKHNVSLILSYNNTVVSIIFSDSRECSLNSLSCTQGCMSECFNIRVNAISVCQYLQLKIFINSASSSLALKSCQEIIIINLQRILSIANSLSATNFCRSELGLHPSPSAAILEENVAFKKNKYRKTNS